jgi:hypothetical protein
LKRFKEKEIEMTTIELNHANHSETTERQNLLVVLHDAFRAYVERRKWHRTVVRMSRLQPHLIRDMGFEPEAIYAAVEGGWDEVDVRQYSQK